MPIPLVRHLLVSQFELRTESISMPEKQITQSQPALAVKPQNEQNEEMTIDLVELMYRLLAGWKLILCLALCVAVAAAVYTFYFVTPLYRATSVIYVVSPDSLINASVLQLANALTSDYIKVFDLWEVHEEVISNLNLDYNYSTVRKMLSVTNTTGTRMLDISVTSPSPTEARDLANEYAKVGRTFIAETMSTDMPNIMSVAREPVNPISPSKTRNIAIGFVLGALLGAAIITFKTVMDDKIKTAEDIRQYTGLVTLAVVPSEELENEETQKNNRSRRKA